MVDKVRPLGLEDLGEGSQEVPLPTELDPTEDYVSTKGVAFEELDTHLIDRSGSDIQFTDPTVGTKSVDDVQSTVRVSANDTTPSTLLSKLAAGALITITETNDGGNETITLGAQGAADEGKLKEIGFHDNSQPDVSISSSSYSVLASFIYGGSTAVGAPTYMKAILHTSATSGDIKIFDSTNAQTIATKNFTNSTKLIIDLGTLSNIPTGEAIFEVQMKRTGGGNAYLAALNMGWV
jgi:hypothetical protein